MLPPPPGGMRTLITGNGVFSSDDSQTQRIGIIPDIIRRPSRENIRSGQDEVMQFAISWLQTQPEATANSNGRMDGYKQAGISEHTDTSPKTF